MSKFIVSKRWELIPLEKKKLIESFLLSISALAAMFLASYLEQFGLPEEFKAVAPFIPFAIQFLRKWAGEHRYKQ